MPPTPARYVMIGGFLGAGKTTSILRAAEWFTARGLRVGLVTNDQAGGLVDTALVRSAAVAELSHRLTDPLDVGRLLINLRAEADPAILEVAVREALETVRGDLAAGVIHSEHFRPGRPVPTHRIPA